MSFWKPCGFGEKVPKDHMSHLLSGLAAVCFGANGSQRNCRWAGAGGSKARLCEENETEIQVGLVAWHFKCLTFCEMTTCSCLKVSTTFWKCWCHMNKIFCIVSAPARVGHKASIVWCPARSLYMSLASGRLHPSLRSGPSNSWGEYIGSKVEGLGSGHRNMC